MHDSVSIPILGVDERTYFPARATVPREWCAGRTHVASWAAVLSLLVLSSVLYLGVAGAALVDEDVDAAHALVAREMLQRHDYVVMYMDGIRYLVRPPMHFCMVAASYALLGESAFSTRLPLALAMVALVLLTYEFGRRFFGQRAGFYAGLVAATSAGMFIFTRVMIPEAIYAVEFTAIFYLFFRSWTGRLDPRVGYWGTAAMCALGMLTRGPIGVLFPVLAIAVFITLTRSWNRWRELRLFTSAGIFLAIAAPWHILAELRAPGFFWAYFVNENINRALGTRWPPDYSAVPLWLWWISHVAWLFPWSLFAPLALRELPSWRTWKGHLDRGSQARLLLFVWTGVILLFFSIESGSRMEYYSFGAWPAMALLLGAGLARAEEEGNRWLRPIQRTLAATGVLIASVLGFLVLESINVPVIGDISARLRIHAPEFYRSSMRHLFDLTTRTFADFRTAALLAALSLLVSLWAAWTLRNRGRHLASNVAVALGMTGFIFAAHLAFLVLEPALSSYSLAQAINKNFQPGDQILLYGDIRNAAGIPFYTHRRVWLYNARWSNLEFGSHYPDAPKVFLTDQDVVKFWNGMDRVFLVVPAGENAEALKGLRGNAAWVLAAEGGKTVYTNEPPGLAQLQTTVSGGGP